MAARYKNGEEYYNKIYLLFNLFIAVSLLPFGYLLLQRQSGQLDSLVSQPYFIYVQVSLLLATAAIIFQAHKSFIAYLKSNQTENNLRTKLDSYKSESVKKYTSFLLANLICVCGLFLTASTLFVVGYIVSIILLSIKRPTLNVIIEDLKLSKEEQDVLIEKREIA